MTSGPPPFDSIAPAHVKDAFLRGGPECVLWLQPGTALYKYTDTIQAENGITAWWLFLNGRVLPNGTGCIGLRERQAYAQRLKVSDADYHRVRLAIDKSWNNALSNFVTVQLTRGAWAYIGKAAGQRVDSKNEEIDNVYFIGGDHQVWVPGLQAADIAVISRVEAASA